MGATSGLAACCCRVRLGAPAKVQGLFQLSNVRSEKISQYMSQGEYRDGGRAVKPKDAATLILVREGDGGPRTLMGKRAAGH